MTSIFQLVYKGAPEDEVKRRVEEYPEEVNEKEKTKYNMTPLMAAVLKDRPTLAEILIQANAVVDAKDNDSWTALMWAVVRNKPSLVQLLLESGADLESRNAENETCLFAAARESPATLSPIITHMLKADKKSVLTELDSSNNTLLHCAAFGGHLASVQLLLAAGGDDMLFKRNKHGKTPEDWTKDKEVAQFLDTYTALVEGKHYF